MIAAIFLTFGIMMMGTIHIMFGVREESIGLLLFGLFIGLLGSATGASWFVSKYYETLERG